MSRVFQHLFRAYGVSCVASSIVVVPSAFMCTWDTTYAMFGNGESAKTTTDIVILKGMSTTITLSVLPAMIMWSPLILGASIYSEMKKNESNDKSQPSDRR